MVHFSGKPVPVTLKTDHVSVFIPILTKGFGMTLDEAATIHDFLAKDLGIQYRYIETRIQTIFLNGKAVDDIRTTGLIDGDTLSLSAAMPGLVGATFRRGSRYAAMRQSISLSGSGKSTPAGLKIITLKLFNLVAKEIGPHLLEQGILIPGSDLIEFLRNQPKDFLRKCKIIMDEKNAGKESLLDSRLQNNTILLRVNPSS